VKILNQHTAKGHNSSKQIESSQARKQSMSTAIQQELLHHDKSRLEFALTMNRRTWDCKMELACDHRPPVLEYYVRSHSAPHLQAKQRWQSSDTANGGAGRDRPPTLKREKSFGSSSLYNASFPLRSRDDYDATMMEPQQAVIIAGPPRSPKAHSPPSPSSSSPMVIKKNDPASYCGLFNIDHPRQDLHSFLAQEDECMTFFLPKSCLHHAILTRQLSSSSSSSHDNMTNILSSAISLLTDDEDDDIDL
jgi:hypothetical protein